MITPPEVADNLEKLGEETHQLLANLEGTGKSDRELQRTLGDLWAMGFLGKYYAQKIRGAIALARFDREGKAEYQAAAIAHLEKARDYWSRYAEIARSQYKPQLLNRIGYVDLHEITPKVEEDILIARQWKPGSLKELSPKKLTGDVPFRP